MATAVVLVAGGRALLRLGSTGPDDARASLAQHYVTPPALAHPAPPTPLSATPGAGSGAAARFLDSDERMPLADLFHLGVRHIVIDPGHGGRDPGTIGPTTGLTEKDLTLDICLRLASLLEADPELRVTLTRSTDSELGLRRRAEIANAAAGDLFLSVHINSFENPEFRGIETFYLGFPTDAGAERVAARENVEGEGRIGEFEALIAKMGDTLKEEESALLARRLQNRLYHGLAEVRGPSIRNYGVRQAPFLVLLDTRMPAVLAEVSLMSDPAEEGRLAHEPYRHQIADLLSAGIRDYIEGLARRRLAASE